MAAHPSGAIIGFLTTTLLADGSTRAEPPDKK